MTIGSQGNKSTRTQSSLDEQLKRQLNYLENSSKLFDKGDHEEAIRLAVTLRVLLHDSTNSTSLLKHLGIKESLQYIDTGISADRLEAAMKAWRDPSDPNLRIAATSPSDYGLVVLGRNPDGNFGWVPPLDKPRFHPSQWQYPAIIGSQPFKPWWTDLLVQSIEGKFFSRKNLVLIMANQDGGAHVDAKLDTDYNNLCSDFLGTSIGEYYSHEGMPESWGSISDISFNPPPVKNNVAYASVRQIAYEVAKTLHHYLANNHS